MLNLYSLLAFAAVGLAAPAADAPVLGVTVGSPGGATATTTAVGPNPTQVYINSISYGGTGCPQNSVGSFISADRQTFTLIFDKMVASIGGGAAVTENRKNCQINMDLQYPSGFQYSILSTQFRGYAYLQSGISGTQQATYYFSGSTAQASTSTNFKGPTDGDYAVSDAIPFTSTIWSPCGAALPLNINTQVRLTGSGGVGQLTQDSADGSVKFVVGVQWQKCTK
jgi:hypothetical protein